MGERIAAKWRWRTVARMATAGTVAFGLCPGLASAGATLQVGPGKPYTKVSDAVAAAAAGDVIEVDPGDYVDDFSIIKQADLTIRGVGGRPHLHAASPVPNKKGIFVVDIDAGLVVEDIEFSGAAISEQDGNNGAGIRMQGKTLIARRCLFHDNQNGILAGGTPDFTVTIEDSEFHDNGQAGYEHNVYIGDASKLVFTGNYSHHAKHGHTLKSRARENHILYNRLMDEADGYSSYLIDLPQGGLSYVIGNLIEQGPAAENTGTIVNYKGEGATNPDLHLYFAHNTVVNDNPKDTSFVRVHAATEVAAYNNLFVGPGTPITLVDANIPLVDMGNLQTDAPGLVDLAGYDYHLAEGSPAIDAGVDPGASLVPDLHYLHPAQTEPRPVVGPLDVGAYEFGVGMGTTSGGTDTDTGGTSGGTSGETAGTTDASTSGGGTSAGGSGSAGSDTATSDASATATATAGSASATGATGATDTAGGDGDDGCACSTDTTGTTGRGALALLLLPLLRRRRR